MYVNSPNLNEIDDDDLFTRPPRSARRSAPPIEHTTRITCRVCETSDLVPLDHPAPLCRPCLADIPTARARVRGWLDSVLAQMDAVELTWQAVRAKYLPLWSKVEDALILVDKGQMTEAQLAERWKARYYESDAWQTLLRAYEERQVELARLGAERARLEAALDLIDTL